jgi:hypothetical protein
VSLAHLSTINIRGSIRTDEWTLNRQLHNYLPSPRPDISKPQISIFSYMDDCRRARCVPFSPGIPELYSLFTKHKLNQVGDTPLFAMSYLWYVSHGMVNDFQHTFVNTNDNMDHFIRETLQRSIRPGGNARTTDRSTLTNQSHASVQWHDDSKEQLAPIDVGIGMKPVENMEQEKEKTTKALAENGTDIEYETETESCMESGSQTETELALDNETGGDILMDFAEKVVEVMDMCKDVKSILGAKQKLKRKRTRPMMVRRTKPSIEETGKNTMKGKNKGGPNGSHQSKASGTSNLKSTVKDCMNPSFMSMQGISPQNHATNNRSVRYKTRFDSTPTADQDLGLTDNTTNPTICTPEEPCLISNESSPDLTTGPGSSNMKRQDFQDAMRLALVGILKDFASGLSM